MAPRPLLLCMAMAAIIVGLAGPAALAASGAAQADNALYADLLNRYVDGGVVDCLDDDWSLDGG